MESKNDKDVKCFAIPTCYLFKVDLNWVIKSYIIGLCFLAPPLLFSAIISFSFKTCNGFL